MQLVERSFLLEATTGLGAKPRPELIGPVLANLHQTLQDSVRMGFLHSSRARGRMSRGIKRAADVRYIGHTAANEHGTLLRFEVAQFGDVAAQLFEQKELWDDGPKATETAFELLGAALNDVQHRRLESNRFDPMLLKRFSDYGRMFRKGRLSRIVLTDSAVSEQPIIDSHVVATAHSLSDATPASRRIRVAGRLDVMGASQGILKVQLESGQTVTARWEGPESIDSLNDLFNRNVVCEGVGIFRPSGSLLRIDADAIARATSKDAAFGQMPTAIPIHDFQLEARVRAGEPSPYLAFIGSVPAEESDEDFAAAIAAMS